jgi:hypothetical protein
VSALALAIWPTFPVVMATRVLQAGASCVLVPVIAAISLPNHWRPLRSGTR